MTKKEIITFLTIILVLISLILPISSYATSANLYQYNYSNYDYEITSYNIDMLVNENNTFDITETITAYFNVSKHGIFRKIPLKNSITRLDGTKSKNKAQISNISVDEDYITYNENGYKVIKIGDANRTLTGSQTYTIKYTYNIGKDPVKNADELYFNLIGNEWDTVINNISFKITMPKSFDKSLLGFSSGQTASTNSSNVKYNVIGNTITGTVNSTLKPGEALTVRLTLPDEYFVGAGLVTDKFSVLVIAVCLACVFIAFRLWAKYGKDEQVIETVEFYPPEGYNSAEAGFLYKGFADNQSIISLLIYLANKGYLKIEEISGEYTNDFVRINNEDKKNANLKIQELENKIQEEKLRNINSPKIRILENSLEIYKNIDKPIEYELSEKEKKLLQKSIGSSKDKFRIIKLKDYDGNNEYERIFFEGLFNKYSNKTSVTSTDLYNNFYMTLNRIKSKLNSRENRHKIFESSASGKGKWLILMMVIIFILITIKPIAEYGDGGMALLPFALLFPGIGFYIMFSMLLGTNTGTLYVNGKPTESRLSKGIFGIVFGLMFGGIPWVTMVLPALIQNTMYLTMYIIGIICIGIIMWFKNIMPKRTPYGNQILGRLRGFKRFLETAEKQELESLVMENPEYFYNILPFTYALDVSDVWINQFESIALEAPHWYNSHDHFSVHTFGAFMNSTMNSASTAMSSSPSSSSGRSSSGGSSSGGGSSGGGSGGGGGGSW